MATFLNVYAGLLTAEENEIYSSDITTDDVTLTCTLAGHLDDDDIETDLIKWTFNGTQLATDTNKYVISISRSNCPPYGLCALGILTIKDPSDSDFGEYMCSFEDMSQTITLIEGMSLWSFIDRLDLHITTANVVMIIASCSRTISCCLY